MLFNLNFTATFPFALSIIRTQVTFQSSKDKPSICSLILYERAREYLIQEFYKYTNKSGKEALIFIEGKSTANNKEVNTELFVYTSITVIHCSIDSYQVYGRRKVLLVG